MNLAKKNNQNKFAIYFWRVKVGQGFPDCPKPGHRAGRRHRFGCKIVVKSPLWQASPARPPQDGGPGPGDKTVPCPAIGRGPDGQSVPRPGAEKPVGHLGKIQGKPILAVAGDPRARPARPLVPRTGPGPWDCPAWAESWPSGAGLSGQGHRLWAGKGRVAFVARDRDGPTLTGMGAWWQGRHFCQRRPKNLAKKGPFQASGREGALLASQDSTSLDESQRPGSRKESGEAHLDGL
jgi:hypothetical protein